jgi:CheY-like chemotaxis protein
VRALIVDDEPTVRLLLGRILRREVDCAVTEATNGIEALDLLSRDHYDFVVIDIMMPIMDGLETLEAIRSTPELRNLPVMVLSAVRDEAQVRQLVKLGVSAYLTKPLRPSDAAVRVQRFVATLGTSTHTPQQGQGRSLLGLQDGARLLVVDGDSDFRHFVRSTLGHQYLIADAEGGAQGLRACLEARPAVILLGQNLGAVAAPMFLRKLRSLPGLASVPVVVAGSRGGEDPPADADAVIQRTFIPDAFKKQFAKLVTGGTPEQRVLLARPELRPQMISATEQVFGMMLGIEVFADAGEPAPPGAGFDLACVVLSLPNEEADIEFGVATEREMGERMTALFLQGADVVTEEDVSSTLQEISNIVSGRLQNALRGRDDVCTIGLPIVSVLTKTLPIAETWAGVGFHNASGDVKFTTFVRPILRGAPGSGAL